ncbi:selenite/tellurite reduction operon rhodanese-like protein ExtH [Desulfurivibrio sp. D14AmB]|uniref:selenite/tellurite reduction operon rhodanese-like protein ExtH n=1 Tax=Desulfurivibrio sp. D14AmB TaxID=3374370 RepID=UPI00376EB810
MVKGKFKERWRPRLFVLLSLLLTVALLVPGCGGSSSYDQQTVASTPAQVMIDAATLNQWVSNGYGTDARGFDKMVILDVDSAAGYAAGHIPGSYNLDTVTDLREARFNGVATTASQVPSATVMDALIQRTGIDERTVVVLVGNGNMMSVGRAYFNFRYWGFPKERLRVLNGTKVATYQDAAGYALATTPPALPAPSSYSVAQLQANIALRATLQEMIGVVEAADPGQVIVDARSAGEYDGTTVNAAVTFGGHLAGAIHKEWDTIIDPENPTALLSPAALREDFEAVDVSPETTVYTYCQTSWRAAPVFLALDGVLGWPVKIYDGAWLEWGSMARNDLSYGGPLEPDSPWRTDLPERSGMINYKNDLVVPIPADEVSAFSLNANLVNEWDKAVCDSDPAVVEDLSGLDPEPDNILIAATDLAEWLAAPATFTTDTGYSNLVVIHVDTATGYANGHIEGAFLLDTAVDLRATRSDGIAPTDSQMPTRAQMDALIQRTGIDEDTVVVLVGQGHLMNVGRAYFNFRYWGFPKERLRVLDGLASHYASETGTALVTTEPDPVVSTYSVCNLPQADSVDRFRASFEEMFQVAGGGLPVQPATTVLPTDVVIADARTAGEYDGTDIRSNVAFGGHVKGAEHLEWTTLIADGKLKAPAGLVADLAAIDSDGSQTVYSYCQTSWRAAAIFLALDGVLGWPTKIYDGAWVQWGQMATSAEHGSLPPSSPWRTDNSTRSGVVEYADTDYISSIVANSYYGGADLVAQEDGGIGGGGVVGGGDSTAPATPGY